MPNTDSTGYLASVSLAARMLDRGIISKKEFVTFEGKMLVKYGLEKESIYRDHRLLCVPGRANITQHEEVNPWKSK